MDLKQLEYIVQIAKENNITHAAEKLFITQSALNQQLLKLEKELGTPLFYRSRTDWRPTAAGEIYIKNAHEILRIKKETYNFIRDIADAKKGKISVGFTPGRGIHMFTNVYPSFHKKYPDVVITPVELSVKKQEELIAHGDLDIGFLTVSERGKANIKYISICDEDIVLAIPNTHPHAKFASNPFGITSITKFKEDSFVLMYKESSLRTLIDDIFKKGGFAPKVLFETSSNSAIVTMIKSGLCCGILPYYYIKEHLDEMACFFLQDYPVWSIMACYRSGSYLSNSAQHFIDLATEFWNQMIPQR